MRTASVEQLRPALSRAGRFPVLGLAKLLQVCSEPVSNRGGVGLIVARLIEQMPKSVQVGLASPDPQNGLPPALQDRISEFLPIPGRKWSVAESRDFVHRISCRGYRLVHFHGGTLSFDAHLPWRSPLHRFANLSIPWAYSNHCAPPLATGLYPEGYPRLKKFCKLMLAFVSLARLASVCPYQIFDSRENEHRMARYFPWAKRRFKTIYHSGIQGEPPPPSMRGHIGTIGNLGHIGWRKGQLDLLQAFSILAAKYPTLELLFVGDAASECGVHLRQEIRRRGFSGRVFVPGPTDDLKAFWDKTDVYVQPSHYEGAPMALMEALWNGKPAVGTSVSGIPEIIENEVSGLLVAPRNPRALADAIDRLIKDAALRQQLASAGPQHIRAKHMTKDAMAAAHWCLYEELCSVPYA